MKTSEPLVPHRHHNTLGLAADELRLLNATKALGKQVHGSYAGIEFQSQSGNLDHHCNTLI